MKSIKAYTRNFNNLTYNIIYFKLLKLLSLFLDQGKDLMVFKAFDIY